MERPSWTWRELWDAVARGGDPFDQMGRGGWTLPLFLTLIAELTEQAEVGPETELLDAGGGAGWVACAFSPFVQAVAVVDNAPAMVARAAGAARSGSFPNMSVYQDDVCSLARLGGRTFTSALCVGVLQYLEEDAQLDAAIAALYRSLAPDGVALFGHNPDLHRRAAWEESLKEGWNELRRAQEERRRWFAPGELEARLQAAGFRDIERLPIHPMLPGAAFMSSLRARR